MGFEFKLPDVGEGLHEGEIVQWYVKEGDVIAADQHMVDVLTDKATVEITSPRAGKISKILAKPGERIQVGQTIVVYEEGNGTASKSAASAAPAASEPAAIAQSAYSGTSSSKEVLATPAVRKLAKDRGLDLAGIVGTGPGGRITEEDILKISSKGGSAAPQVVPAGAEERLPLKGIRRRTAEKMVQSRRTVAHVTHVDEVDMTDLMAYRERQKVQAEQQGVKLTVLSYILKATAKSLEEYPYLNASIDDDKQEIVLKKYINLSVAVDTEHGLFTPVIKDANQKFVIEIAKDLETLIAKVKTGKADLSVLQGGTFTITNIGPIGGLVATPIVNHPEAGILGVMKIVKRPVVRDNAVVIRDMMNLCLSFDHRITDGAYAARFVSSMIAKLQNPAGL